MHKILELLQKQNKVTGMKILDNPFDFGRCDVVDAKGESLFRGDRISCQVFINRQYDKILSEGTTFCGFAMVGKSKPKSLIYY